MISVKLMRIALLVFSTPIFFTFACFAKDTDNVGLVYGVANETCGKMTDDVEKHDIAKQAYISYIDGYLSSYNMHVTGSSDFFEGTDSLSRYKFVLKYCENNPLDKVLIGIHQIILKYDPPRTK